MRSISQGERAPRASLVTLALLPRDAISKGSLAKVEYLLARGYETRIFYETLADAPGHLRDKVYRLSLEQVLHPGTQGPELRPQIEHLRSSDFVFYEYGLYYPLLETIKLARDGITFLDYHGLTPPRLWGDGPGAKGLTAGIKRAGLAKEADCILAHSRFARRELADMAGIDPERIQVLPYPISSQTFYPMDKDASLIARHGLEGQFVLLYVGRMAGNKKVEHLVEALALVKEKVPNTKLLLIGEASSPPYNRFAERARRMAQEKGVEADVLFLGQVPDELLNAYYNLADIFVTASLHEGFCLPVVEALACGKPVVASDAAALPEIVGDAGLTFPAGDVRMLAERILALLGSPELRAELGHRGLERAKLFSPTLWEARMDEILERALREKGREFPLPTGSVPPQGATEKLRQEADIAMRDYAIRSDKPFLGLLIAWMRRNLTSHLREPYLDPIIERQVSFNLQAVELLKGMEERLARLEAQMERIERLLEGKREGPQI